MGKGTHEDNDVIDDLGGTGVVAKMLRCSASRVSDWRNDGIPDQRRQTLALLYNHLPRDWLPVKPVKPVKQRKRRAKMSHYETLDRQIVEAIERTGGTDFTDLLANHVSSESARIANSLGREQFRVLDGRLQALRKRGLIIYGGGKWRKMPDGLGRIK